MGSEMCIRDRDELGESERMEGSFLHELLFGELLPFVSVILTSRPVALAPLVYVDRFVEYVALTEKTS